VVSESRIYAAASWRIMPLLMAGWLFAYMAQMVEGISPAKREALFWRNAARFYRLEI
jgi:predicted TIM-barrel fold metal-dependent hydrolase